MVNLNVILCYCVEEHLKWRCVIVEVIYRDGSKNKINIPKNVRQIGTDNGKLRIYIEDYAYSFIKDITIDEDDDGVVGILMGTALESDGIKYIFIKGVVEVTNAAVFTDHIAFTSETWPITKKYINAYFGEYDIMGWYLCSTKINDKNMDIINKADKESFVDKDNVFFMVNSVSGDEAFFAKDKKGLVPVQGYTVFFEKNTAMQRYMREMQSEYDEKYTMQNAEEEPQQEKQKSGGQYRSIKKETSTSDKSIKRNLTLIYAFSMLIIIVVLVIGINKINSYDKLSGLGDSESLEANATLPEQTSKTPVTTLDGNITEEVTTQEVTKEEATTEEVTTEEPTTEEPTTQEPTTQEPTTQADQTYVIQANDTMWSICVKFYGAYSETAANKILSYNNMTINDIQIGKTIKIPSDK